MEIAINQQDIEFLKSIEGLETELLNLFPLRNEHLTKTFSHLLNALFNENQAPQDLLPHFILNYSPDINSVRVVERLRNRLHITMFNEDFSKDIATKFDLFFCITSLFAFLKSHAVPNIKKNQKITEQDVFSPMIKEILAQEVVENPDTALEAIGEAHTYQNYFERAFNELQGFIKLTSRSGRNNYFLAYWLCSEIAEILKKYNSRKPIHDLILILEHIQSDNSQFFTDFPPLDYETIKQAAKRGRKLTNKTQSTVEGV